jgi:hypothetical protein
LAADGPVRLEANGLLGVDAELLSGALSGVERAVGISELLDADAQGERLAAPEAPGA